MAAIPTVKLGKLAYVISLAPWGMGLQIANNEVGQGVGAGVDEARAIEVGGSYSVGPGITMVGGVQVHDLSAGDGDPGQENDATVIFIGTFLGF